MPKIKIFEDLCKGCRLCTSVCPVKILKMNESSFNIKGYHPVTVVDMSRCTGCGFCHMICPDCAIEIEK